MKTETAAKKLIHPENVTEHSTETRFTIPEDFPAFQGHFPGNPILPGVVLIMFVRLLIEKAVNCDLVFTGLSRVKFFAPVKAGDQLCIRADWDDSLTGNAGITVNGNRTASLKFTWERRSK